MEYCSARERFTLTDRGQIEGYASVFGSVAETWIPTVFEPGTWTKTLKEHFSRVRILWQHSTDDPIGLPLEMREDKKSLWVKGQLSETAKIADYRTLLRDGVVDSISVGFDPITHFLEERANVPGGILRHITEAALWEWSVVTFPADSQAIISNVSSRAPQARRYYSIAEMEALVRQYQYGRQTPARMPAPTRPLFPAQSAFRPETDSQYAARIEQQMVALHQQEESERYYQRARHQHRQAHEDFVAHRRALGW